MACIPLCSVQHHTATELPPDDTGGDQREAVTHADPKVLKSAQAKEHEAQ